MKNALLNPILIAVIMAGLVAVSCDRNRFFEENKKIGRETWRADKPVDFEVKITDTLARYTFFLNVRNDLEYPYSNLYLFMKTTFPGGRFSQDTIECQLAGFDGKWLGSGIGSVRFNRFLVQENIRFPKAGTYVFSIVQAMRTSELKGITDVGIRIEKK